MSHYGTIVVASGKGGTGKTTIAANLASYLAAMEYPVQYIDCDVEEPNGAIFLKPDFSESLPVNVSVPQVDLERCTGCGKCGQMCQYNAIVSVGPNVLTFENLCHSCGGCMQVCPVNAITEKPVEIGQIRRGSAGKIDCVQGLLKIGSVRTPTLIQQVKACMNPEAIRIIDAPPGTSCPVIAAVRDADYVILVTEPTPFGLHDLKLAAAMVRKLGLPFSVVINRQGVGDDRVESWCRQEQIEITMMLPDDRRIAESYSAGRLICDDLPQYQSNFQQLAERWTHPKKS